MRRPRFVAAFVVLEGVPLPVGRTKRGGGIEAVLRLGWLAPYALAQAVFRD